MLISTIIWYYYRFYYDLYYLLYHKPNNLTNFSLLITTTQLVTCPWFEASPVFKTFDVTTLSNVFPIKYRLSICIMKLIKITKTYLIIFEFNIIIGRILKLIFFISCSNKNNLQHSSQNIY